MSANETTAQAVPGCECTDSGRDMTKDEIRAVFMAHGLTVKEGQTDLKDYVYQAAQALLERDRAACEGQAGARLRGGQPTKAGENDGAPAGRYEPASARLHEEARAEGRRARAGRHAERDPAHRDPASAEASDEMSERDWHIRMARTFLAQAMHVRRYPQHSGWHATLFAWAASRGEGRCDQAGHVGF
jgi:hypothetical protein